MELEVIDTDTAIKNHITEFPRATRTGEYTFDYAVLAKSCPNIRNIQLNYGTLKREFPTEVLVRLINYDLPPVPIGKILHSEIGKIVNVDGVVRKVSSVRQDIIKASYDCGVCGSPLEPFYVKTTTLKIPNHIKCPINTNHSGHLLDPQRCIYQDIQYIEIQEPHENVEGGKQPKSIRAVLSGSMVDSLKAGNRVRLTAVVSVLREKDNDKIISLKLDIIGINRGIDDYTDMEITKEDEEQIKILATLPNITETLRDAVAPSIYGLEDIKLSIVLMMFGGVSTHGLDGIPQRGHSHILLVGDPGVAKSQLVKAAVRLCPRAVYTSGKSSSAAGLTAAAIKDDIDGRWSLEAGAMVLADNGVCVVDELDKMTSEDRSALHEAMEQQSISIHKAGIATTLPARCSLLAAANPKIGKFIPGVSLVDQIDLPPALLSRFDVIWMIVDTPDEASDLKVADHLLKVREASEKRANGKEDILSEGLANRIDDIMFRKYVLYSQQINPILTPETRELLKAEYVRMRSKNQDIYTLRQLEALVRLAEASARIRLDKTIRKEDVERAVYIQRKATESISINTETDNSIVTSSTLTGYIRDAVTYLNEHGDTPSMDLTKYMTELTGSDVTASTVAHAMFTAHMIESKDGLVRLTTNKQDI